MDSVTVGDRIRMLRRLHGMSLRGLSELSGITRPAIANIERGRNLPAMTTAVALADVFGVSIDFLVGRGVVDDG